MLEVLQLPPKPRKNCMILMSEVGIPLRATEQRAGCAGVHQRLS